MLLDLETLVTRHHMNVTGVLHAGAHLAEEADDYDRLFPGAPVLWVEANPAVLDRIWAVLRPYPHQVIWQGLLWEEDGIELPFNVTNHDGMSSSILEFGTHPQFSPETRFVAKHTLTSITLDTIVRHQAASTEAHGGPDTSRINLLNMDLQGVELQCLRGAEQLLAQIDYIYSEVNTAEVYVGCTKLSELDAHLRQRGFRRVATSMVPKQGWGDGLWVRRT